jgi:hypothetical protein
MDRLSTKSLRQTPAGAAAAKEGLGHGTARRSALRQLTACLFAVSRIPFARGRAEENIVCVNPSALSDAQKRQRALDNYTERSPDPTRTCSACQFFTPGAAAITCGKCDLFNGPANSKGKCDDWTARLLDSEGSRAR